MILTRCKEEVWRWQNNGIGCPGRGRCLIPGNIQVQVGWGSEQSGLVEDVSHYCRELDWMAFKGSIPTQTILWFYELREWKPVLGFHMQLLKPFWRGNSPPDQPQKRLPEVGRYSDSHCNIHHFSQQQRQNITQLKCSKQSSAEVFAQHLLPLPSSQHCHKFSLTSSAIALQMGYNLLVLVKNSLLEQLRAS